MNEEKDKSRSPSSPNSKGNGTSKSYWEDTRRPIYSAMVVLPFLLVYELGVLILKPNAINGGDALVRTLLNTLSVHTAFGSALVLLICFIAWQFYTRASWKIDSARLGMQFIESFLIAVVLFFLMGTLSKYLPREQVQEVNNASEQMYCMTQYVSFGVGSLASAADSLKNGLVYLVLFCGAGVYEELVFRVLLLGLLVLILTKLIKMEKTPAILISIFLGAVLFSLFHYVGSMGDAFHINSFVQRVFAGVFFAALYYGRSFGIAAASHALYDILVGLSYVF